MNTAGKSILFAAFCLSLAACASTSEPRASVAPSSDGYDQAYIAAVERAGRVRGVKVVWVHPPEDEAVASND